MAEGLVVHRRNMIHRSCSLLARAVHSSCNSSIDVLVAYQAQFAGDKA